MLWVLVSAAATMSPAALADDASAMAILRAGCAGDVQRLCANVQPGGGRILACLKAHRPALSDQCKQAAQQAQGAGASPIPATPSAPSAVAPTSGVPPASPAPPPAAAASKKAAVTTAATGSYLRMKKVQIIDRDPQAQGQPALELLIPSDWSFQGVVSPGGGKGGCFSDLFALSFEAKSADGSTAFQGAPDYSWQYTDDPTELRTLNDPNRRALGAGGKPCPVAKPSGAEAYFRENIAGNLPSGSAIVSVEPFPELNQIARQQLGLPSGDGGGVRTDAIRARTTGRKDGKPVDSWIALAVATRVYPVGRGSFYDCHAVDFVAFVAPQGKLDGNEKLFYAMLSSIRREPKWVERTSAMVAKLYQAQAQKLAQQDQALAAFQNKVTQTINATTMKAEQGANQSVHGFDQNIRGVQTFRDPSTGNTFELSNQYDHAWLNGSNEYVMSDDPNFNPNVALSGSWNELQTVQPSP